jgi:hypothetical protein
MIFSWFFKSNLCWLIKDHNWAHVNVYSRKTSYLSLWQCWSTFLVVRVTLDKGIKRKTGWVIKYMLTAGWDLQLLHPEPQILDLFLYVLSPKKDARLFRKKKNTISIFGLERDLTHWRGISSLVRYQTFTRSFRKTPEGRRNADISNV